MTVSIHRIPRMVVDVGARSRAEDYSNGEAEIGVIDQHDTKQLRERRIPTSYGDPKPSSAALSGGPIFTSRWRVVKVRPETEAHFYGLLYSTESL
ncbi:hypothetical protein GWI33_006879 [Rhynchophorus ferrugineus]|uniref:Uncharacterized protein n=1 Tax=Rhynchophorus ferrugineus TaxID=354439 RepID=A0A834IE78_RHYFE|nr:hypothetical protein GWI33_006879 [Rhynchophorus ferrugineus]